MLSISSISSSGGAAKYYSKEDYHKTENENALEGGLSAKEAILDYYTKQESEGEYVALEWAGKGAEYLGLEGKVDPKDLEMVLERVNPDAEGEALSPKEAALRRRINGDEIFDEYEQHIDDESDVPYGLDQPFHDQEPKHGDGPGAAPASEKAQEPSPAASLTDTPAGLSIEASGPEIGPDARSGHSTQPSGQTLDERAADRRVEDRDGPEADTVHAAVEKQLTNWEKMSREERLDAIRALNAEVRTANGEVRQTRHGWDMTFSASKSVSILALGPDGDKRLLEAHQESVSYALQYMEDNFSTYRQRDGKGAVETHVAGNLLMATTQHALSRAADKQLHTHVLVANAVRGEDEKWHALDNSKIFEYKQLLGGIYQAHMRQLVQGLGYNVRDGKDLSFEISGVSQQAMDAQSTRSQQINDNLKAMEEAQGSKLTRDQIEHAKLKDRPDKVTLTLDQIYQRWKDVEKAVGFDAKQLVDQAKNTLRGIDVSLRDQTPFYSSVEAVFEFFRPDKKLVVNDLNDSVRYASGQVFDKTTVATPHDVILAAMKANGAKYSAEQILASPAWQEQGFIEASRRGVHGGITTKDALATEKAIIKAVKSELNSVKAYDKELVARALSPEQLQKIGIGFQLTPGQYEAAYKVLASSHGVITIQGTAGAGKTTSFQAIQSTVRIFETVKAVERVSSTRLDSKLVALFETDAKKAAFDRELAKQSGIKGTAPTHTAKTELEGKGIETSTLAKLQQDYRLAKELQGKHSPGKFNELRKDYQGSTLLVDETSMLGNKAMLELLQMKKDLGIQRLVLSGDKMQIASLKAGAAFELIQNTVKETVTEMKQVVRQTNTTIREAVELFAEGKGTAALNRVSKMTHEIGRDPMRSYADTNKELAQAAHAKWLQSGKKAMVITATNELRGLMNGLMRHSLKEAGKIKGTVHEQSTFVSKGMDEWDRKNARNYSKGDIIVFHADSTGFKRDQVVRVLDMNTQGKNNYLVVTDEKTNQETTLRLDWVTRGNKQVRFDVYKERSNEYQRGDQILFNKNDKKAGIEAKKTYDVKEVRPDGIVVAKAPVNGKDQDDTRIFLPAESHALRFTNYAYAKTIDLAQGVSVPKVIAVFNTSIKGDFINATRAYIANSRPIQSLDVIVDSKKLFMQKVGENSGLNRIALDHLGNTIDQQARDDSFGARQKASFEDLKARKARKKDPIESKIVDDQKDKAHDPNQPQQPADKTRDAPKPKGYTNDTTLTKGEKVPVLVQEAPKVVKVKVTVKGI